MNESPKAILESIDTSRPEVTYKGPKAQRDSSELLSGAGPYLRPNGAVLDLGCGPRDQAVPIDHLGHHYVGIDIANAAADIRADAHSIPFKSTTFDCVLSYATLEHLHNPFLAITEVERVLKPGGVFVGTVSQGEPFHASYFHHTAWGLISLVTAATSLSILRMWSSGDTLRSLARMGRYPKVIKGLLGALDLIHEKVPSLAPRRMNWSQEEKLLDELYRAGSICFVMQKVVEG